jgi:hypothetical protein
MQKWKKNEKDRNKEDIQRKKVTRLKKNLKVDKAGKEMDVIKEKGVFATRVINSDLSNAQARLLDLDSENRGKIKTGSLCMCVCVCVCVCVRVCVCVCVYI